MWIEKIKRNENEDNRREYMNGRRENLIKNKKNE